MTALDTPASETAPLAGEHCASPSGNRDRTFIDASPLWWHITRDDNSDTWRLCAQRQPRYTRAQENTVSAHRHTLRLYWRSRLQRQTDLNIDPKDDGVLRARLEAMVITERGSLNLDLGEWSLVAHSLGGGQVKARCTVSATGQTVVRR